MNTDGSDNAAAQPGCNAMMSLARKRAKTYGIRQRPITKSIFVASVVLIGLLTIFVDSFFKIEDKKISIGLFTSHEQLAITSGRVNISKGASGDEVFVSVGLTNNGLSEANFTLSVPEDFTLYNSSVGSYIELTGRHTKKGATYHYFRVSSGQTASLMMVFQAYVVSTSAPELNLRVLFDGSGNHLPPVSVMIAGLNGSDIVNVDPAPSATLRSSYALGWPVLPESGIWLQLRDRSTGYRREFIVLLAGIFIGIFSSLLTGIILDTAKETELRLGSDT